jgi:signal transduction histidine kinase
MIKPKYSNHTFCIPVTAFRFLVFVSLLLVYRNSAAQQPVLLNDNIDVYPIGSSLMIFEDTSGVLPLDSISNSTHTTDFKHATWFVPNLGFSHSAFWFKFDLQDSSSRKREWVLDIAMPSLHEVDFFIISDSTRPQATKTGFTVGKKLKSTPFRNPSMEFAGLPGTTFTIYARIKSETPIIAPVFIREKKRYIEYDRTREFLLGLYFGALLVMALYHFYLFLSTKDRGYLWLVLFIACYGFGQMTAVYGFLSDWGVSGLGSLLRWLHAINYLAAFFGIALSRSMVQSERSSPRGDFVLKALLFIIGVFVPLSPLMSFMAAERLLLLFNIIPLPFLVYTSIVAYRKGHQPALYYLLATSAFIAGLAVYNLMYGFDLFPFHGFIYFVPNLSFVITLTLFSMGLAHMINSFKREREKAREKALADLHEKLHLQEEKSIIERELEQARKMETIGRLLNGVAHDMNNLLHPIIGYAVLLRKECKTNDKVARQAENLVNSTQRLNELALTLVNASRTKPTGIILLDFNNAVVQIGSLLKHSCPRNVSIIVNQSKCILSIKADAGLLYGAILTLGIKVIDSMPGDGSVIISTGNTSLDESHSARRKFNVPEGSYATVSIGNTENGAEPKALDQLCELFLTTPNDGIGTGHVFAGVYNCMKEHKGCIDVYNESGIGSGITLFFPMEDCVGVTVL